MYQANPTLDVSTEAGLDAWLAVHASEMTSLRADSSDDLNARVAKDRALLGYLTDRGVTGWGWPIEYGGRGGTEVHRAVFYDQLTRHGFGMPECAPGLEVLGSALAKYAPTLAAKYLTDMLSGRSIWCQGFSEPEAGSDLAALRTTATRVDAGWIIKGQKVWTSLAHLASWCGLLARTGPPNSRHRGLTLFWADMREPGVSVRPLRTLSGEDDFCEVFFDGTVVPDDHRVGGVDEGWDVAMHLLQFERGMWAWQRQAIMHAALEDAITRLRDPATHSAAIARAYLAAAAVRSRSRSTVERLARGETLGPEVSADKLLLGQAEHIVYDAIRSVSPGFELSSSPNDSALRREWFYSRAATVYGGSADIQRNIVAQRVLGLPREMNYA